MPEAKTLDFCPNCGCSDVVNRWSRGVTFDCDEQVTRSAHDDRLITNYSCRRSAAYWQRLERTLADAMTIFPALRVTAEGLHILRQADARYPDTTGSFVRLEGVGTRQVQSLTAMGFIETGPHAGMVRITEWGHLFYQSRKEAVT